MWSFLQGITLGLAYVAPIGLQNLFVINTALTQPKKRVYATAFIVVFFDITLALACFFGIGLLMASAKWLEMLILLIGSLVVIWIGLGLVRDTTVPDRTAEVDIPLVRVVTMACVVTWFNPQAVIDGSMLLGAFKATLPPGGDIPFITGVATASFCWFIGLSTLISLFSAQITDRVFRMINIACGAVIMFYGGKLFVNFIQLLL